MRRALALLALMLLPAAPAAAEAARVQILAAAEGEPYATTARELAAALTAQGIASERVVIDDSWRGAGEARLVVALGTRAAEAALHGTPRRPVLAALLPRQAWRDAQSRATPGADAALWLDQPAERQLRLLRLVLPRARVVTALFGASTHEDRPRLERAAAPLGLELRSRIVGEGEDPARALGAQLDETDVVLALPDPRVWNRVTAQPLLLATFRAGKPVLAFSPAFVRAGAVAAVHTTPQQTAEELAELIRGLDLAAPRLPESRGPRRFEVTTNPEVARALGLTLGDGAALAARLRAGEDAP